MKKAYLWFSLILSACSGEQGSPDETPKPDVNSGGVAVMTFEKKEHNFGTIREGQTVSHEFRFKNTGSADLIIVKVDANCGCTASEYPAEPIKPGEEEKIVVTFDSKGRKGLNEKKVQIIYNGKPKVAFLKIKVNVI